MIRAEEALKISNGCGHDRDISDCIKKAANEGHQSVAVHDIAILCFDGKTMFDYIIKNVEKIREHGYKVDTESEKFVIISWSDE